MATRRKYKVPHYRDGGRVLADMPIEGDEPKAAETAGFPSGILGDQGAGDQPAEPRFTPSTAEPPPADDNPLMHALAAQARAEQLQREAAQRPPPSAIEHRIEKIPGLSDHKKNFLRQFPVLIEDPAVMQVFNRHYAEALQSGFTDDTSELDNHLITATVREIEHRRQLALASESDDVHLQRLEDEAEAIMRNEQPPAPSPSPPAPPRRRSIPMSAPVSRDAPTYSGRAQSASNPMTLSPEERDIAHRSYTAPNMTDAQKEYEYAKNKRLMIQRKASGEIQG